VKYITAANWNLTKFNIENNKKSGLKGLYRRLYPTGKVYLGLFVLLIVLCWSLGALEKEVYAAGGFKIYDYSSKKTTVYTGIVPTVTVNGKKIGDEKAKGILVDGVALLPYDIIFEKSIIAADCTYNKSKESVTISKYGITITLTVGSKKATVNGKQVMMSVAPKKVKYVDSGLTKILVPSRFVSETLGLGYSWNSSTKIIAIEKKTISLSYNNQSKFEYSNLQTKVTIDGVNIDLGNMPGIIVNNIAMLRAKRVFADSSIAAEYSYNKTDKKVTLKKNGKTLVMTIGSKTAYLNGKKVELENAPLLVTNHDINTSYVMVPGRSTAKYLGYDYVWDKTAVTSRINSISSNSSNGSDSHKSNTGGNGSGKNANESSSTPELGDDGVYPESGTVIKKWKINDLSYGIYEGKHDITGNLAYSGIAGQILYASNNYITRSKNSDTFMFISNAPMGDISSYSNAGVIRIAVKNFGCTQQFYQVNNTESSLVNAIAMYNNSDSNEAIIELNMTAEDCRYDIGVTDDKKILLVTVYKNTLSQLELGSNDNGDYISFEAFSKITAEITDYTGQIYIKLSDLLNGLGDFAYEVSGAKFIRNLIVTTGEDGVHILLVADPGYEYYLMENDNKFTLYIKAQENRDNLTEETGAIDPSNITDKSSYEIVIPKPGSVAKSMITDEDFYHDGYFVIRLKGDYTDFYNKNKIKYSSSNIKNITVSLNKNGETEIKVYTSKLQGYRIATDSETICVDIGEPREIYKNIVVLDPGHGGAANGAQYFGTKEKDLNLRILYTVGKKYFNSDTSKLKVYYTRYSDEDISLDNRAAFAKKVGADLFVSLHMNAADASVRGTEVFYSVKNNSANSAGLTSQKLAEILCANLCSTLGTKNRGVKQANLVVTNKNTVPAVLIELGFMSNKDDYALLTNAEFQDKAAKTIYESLLEVFKKYPTGR